MSAFDFPPGPSGPATPPDPWAYSVGTEVLPAPDDAEKSPSSRLRWLLVGGIAFLSLALIAGIAFAVNSLTGGGGAQPEDALPPGAIAFAKVDLDPSIGQKVDGIRFARKFPELRSKVSEDSDLRRVLFDAVHDEVGWGAIDYATGVEPWLGNRVGVGVYPPKASGGDEISGESIPEVIVALEVTDEDAARKGLDRLITSASAEAAQSDDDVKYVIVGDYALITATDEAAKVAAGPVGGDRLGDDPEFRADLDDLGEGLAVAWADLEGLTRLGGAFESAFGGGLGLGTAGGSGRAAYLIRFDGPSALEVVGKVAGSDVTVEDTHPLKGFGDLPDDSVVAFGMADGDKYVPEIFRSVRKTLADAGEADTFDEGVAAFEAEVGIELPEDLAVLFGSNFLATLGDLSGGDTGIPDFGARITTDAARANEVLDKIEDAAANAGEELPIVRRDIDGGLVVASSERHADRLAAKGKLGESERFQRAMPEIDGANAAFYVDLASIIEYATGEMTGESVDENLEPLLALGMTATSDDGANGTFRMRLIVR